MLVCGRQHRLNAVFQWEREKPNASSSVGAQWFFSGEKSVSICSHVGTPMTMAVFSPAFPCLSSSAIGASVPMSQRHMHFTCNLYIVLLFALLFLPGRIICYRQWNVIEIFPSFQPQMTLRSSSYNSNSCTHIPFLNVYRFGSWFIYKRIRG